MDAAAAEEVRALQVQNDLPGYRNKSYALLLTAFLSSRAGVYILGNISHYYVTPFDSSNRLLHKAGVLFCVANWDGVYFTHIAQFGYTFEQMHAFFPLYPMIVWGVERFGAATYLRPFDFIMVPTFFSLNSADKFSLAAALVSHGCFMIATLLLARFTSTLMNDAGLGVRAAILFCFNPASVFFHAAYSESLFAMLAFFGMYLLVSPPDDESDSIASVTKGRVLSSGDEDEDEEDALYEDMVPVKSRWFCLRDLGRDDMGAVPTLRRRIFASIFFGLATLARAQGVLLCIHSLFASYRAWNVAQKSLRAEHRLRVLKKHCVDDQYQLRRDLFWMFWKHVLVLGIIALIHATSLVIVLGHGYMTYCMVDHGNNTRRPWCDDWSAGFPNIYTYVQSAYWNQGLFRYYESKQIPNFVLAVPITIISLHAVIWFALGTVEPAPPSAPTKPSTPRSSQLFPPSMSGSRRMLDSASSPTYLSTPPRRSPETVSPSLHSTTTRSPGLSPLTNFTIGASAVQQRFSEGDEKIPSISANGLLSSSSSTTTATTAAAAATVAANIAKKKSGEATKMLKTYPQAYPHIVQLLITVLIAWTCMHVQVATRFICASCPIVYVFVARFTRSSSSTGAYFMLAYFITYYALGTALFCGFFPWT